MDLNRAMRALRTTPIVHVALAAMTLASPAAAQPVVGKLAVEKTLSNGLRIVVIPTDSPGTISYYTLVRSGSRDEVESGKSGYAHLFEHMMFRGTRTVSRDLYEKSMQQMGADNNAYTTDDYTLYTITLPKSGIDSAIRVESDRFQNLEFSDGEYRDETGAVLGEYSKGAADPGQRMWETLSEVAYRRHPYGHTTIGYLKDVRRMPENVAYARTFFRRHYVPNNCTIIVTGDVNSGDLLPKLANAYRTWSGARADLTVPAEPPQMAPRSRALHWLGATADRMLVAYKTPAYSARTNDVAALEVAHAALFSEASPLYERLVLHDKTLLEFGSFAGSLRRDPGLFIIEAKLAPKGKFESTLKDISEMVGRVAKGEVDNEAIVNSRQHIARNVVLSMQSPGGAAETIAHYAQLAGDTHEVDRFLESLGSVTKDDVVRVVRTYLVPQVRSVVTMTSTPRGRGQ